MRIQAAAAISGDGDAIVAWGSQDGGEQADEPWVVRAARLARGTRRFSAAQTLDAGAGIERPQGGLELAFAPGGTATVAWSAVAGSSSFPIMTATAAAGRRFGRAQTLAPSGAVADLGIRADGAATVSWSALLGLQRHGQAFAAARPAGAAAFGAPEALGPLEMAGPPLVAFHPVDGRPTAVWGRRLGQRHVPAGATEHGRAASDDPHGALTPAPVVVVAPAQPRGASAHSASE